LAASATAETSKAPAPAESPARLDVPPPIAPGASATSAIAPGSSAETTTAAADEPPLGANESELDVTCTPECDRITIDGRPRGASPLTYRLAPGPHQLEARRVGFSPVWVNVVTAPGERRAVPVAFKATFAPAGPKGPAPKPPCGKFLKRCD
jgi:hypothetical protein